MRGIGAPRCISCRLSRAKAAIDACSLRASLSQRRPTGREGASVSSEGLPDEGGLAVHRAMCKNLHMATNLAIDDDLLDEALKVGGQRTKKATVTQALEEYIQHRKQKDVLKLFGKVEMDPDYDYKAQRRRK